MESSSPERWELYKLLSEPLRLRMLALTRVEELSIGELAELCEESQPNVSRHVSALRRVGLLSERKHGTRVFVGFAREYEADAVVQDACTAGDKLVQASGGFDKLAKLLVDRDAPTREFFARERSDEESALLPAEMGAMLSALAPLLPHRAVAVDVGTGDGRSLEVLAPLFQKVYAIEREEARLAKARARAQRRGFSNVTFRQSEIDDADAVEAIEKLGGADVVFVSRVLHHAARPQATMNALAKMLGPRGTLVCVEYESHTDESMRTEQADLWLGFSREELTRFAKRAGLERVEITSIPRSLTGAGADHGLKWHVLTARRAAPSESKQH